MLEVRLLHAIEYPWTTVSPLRVGTIPAGLGTPDRFVTVGDGEQALLRVDVYGGGTTFEDVIAWRDWVVVGFGERVHLVSLQDRSVRSFDLESYFGGFFPCEEYLLVASADRLFRVAPDGTVVWSTEPVGLDGVLVDRVEAGCIYGVGEWDPPGGWQPFAVDLDTGKTRTLQVSQG